MPWSISPNMFVGFTYPRWYGLFFAIGTLLSLYSFLRSVIKRQLPLGHLSLGISIVASSTLVFMRVWHCFFYEFEFYSSNLASVFDLRRGGFASHGGVVGMLLGLVFYLRVTEQQHLRQSILTFAAVSSFWAYGFIRIGNFFHSEVIGTPTDLPWGIVFTQVDTLARHPVQIYEALGYWLCAIFLSHQVNAVDIAQSKLRLIFAASFVFGFTWRFSCEFFKANHYNTWLTSLTPGQIYSLPFILYGLVLLVRSRRLADEVNTVGNI